jgi:hypothetical protein
MENECHHKFLEHVVLKTLPPRQSHSKMTSKEAVYQITCVAQQMLVTSKIALHTKLTKKEVRMQRNGGRVMNKGVWCEGFSSLASIPIKTMKRDIIVRVFVEGTNSEGIKFELCVI